MTSMISSFRALLLILVLCAILVSCGHESNILTPISTQRQVTNTITPVTKQDQLRTPTHDIEAVATSLPEITVKSEPTLTIQQRDKYIQNLLQNNPNCKLPCWWGIEPGKTGWAEAEIQLKQMGMEPTSTIRAENQIHHEVHFDQISAGDTIINWIEFEEKEKYISSIKAKTISNGNSEQFFLWWKNFSPEIIMKSYGEPDRIWLQSTSSGRNVVGYTLWLFYDSQGFLIISGGNTDRKETYTICPSFSAKDNPIDLEIVIRSSKDSIPLESLTEQYDPVSKPYILPIEKATTLSTDTFYTDYLEKGNSFCFETPKKIWPK